MNRLLLLSVFLFALSAPRFNALAGEDRSLEVQRLIIAERIVAKLISQNICENRSDCAKREVFFIGPSRDGLFIEFYSITERAALESLLIIILMSAEELPSSVGLHVDFVRESKGAQLKKWFWQRNDSFIMMKIKGGRYVNG